MAKMASPYVIELTVISGEGLLLRRNQPVKKNAFVVVRSDPFCSRSTGTDREGGSYPFWNEKMVMELPASARFLTVEAHSGAKRVGSVVIPVSDFAGGFLPVNYLSFLSYRLRGDNGAKNGILNLSVRVKASPGGGGGCSGEAWARVPAVEGKVLEHQRHGIVTGIPVSYRY